MEDYSEEAQHKETNLFMYNKINRDDCGSLQKLYKKETTKILNILVSRYAKVQSIAAC